MAKKKEQKTDNVQVIPAPEKVESGVDKLAREAGNVKPVTVTPIMTGTTEDGSKVERRDPRVELQREQGRMAMGFGEYEPLLAQTTNLDHPVHANSLIHDMTELELMRIYGLPENMYKVVKGEGMKTSGFYGFMRLRQAILYPPPDGIYVHPRMLLFSGQRQTKDELKPNQRNMLTRLLAGEV